MIHLSRFIELFDRYLAWCQSRRAATTYEWYHERIQKFISHHRKLAQLPASEILPYHVLEWIEAHGTSWGNAYRRGAITAIQRPYNWAVQLGYIDRSSIARIEKLTAGRREQVMLPADWEKVRNHYPEGDPFRDLLEFAYETGCRPQEAKAIEARHIDLARQRVIFPKEESKGKKRARVILLTTRAASILERRLVKRCKGVVFVNADGNRWTSYAMACRFGRLKKHLGIKWTLLFNPSWCL